MSSLPEPTSLRVRTTEFDDDVDLVANLRPGGWLWLGGDEGICAWGEAARVDVRTGPEGVQRASRALTRLFESASVEADDVSTPGLVAFGSFSFDHQQSGSVLVIPTAVLRKRDGRSWLTVVDDYDAKVRFGYEAPASSDRVRYAGTTASELEWLEAVASAVAEIEQGRYDKVVLARDLLVWSKDSFDLRALASRLATRFPECFTFAAGSLVGASPELLVSRRGDEVASTVLAGSAPRSTDPAEDASLGARLLGSSKERHEHQLAVASVVEPLKKICTEVEPDAAPSLLRLANVQHLATGVRARVAADKSALDLAGLLHPTAAVCGAPTEEALDAIRRLERMRRGRYAGPVGWVDARGDGDWTIALRCGEFSGHRGRLFAGAGIVEGSAPESELEETRLKLKAMQSVLAS